MKHSVLEIFRIENANNKTVVFATRRFIENSDIIILQYCDKPNNHLVWARPMGYRVNNGKPLRVLDIEGEKLAWFYGEKIWFDSVEELAAHRILVSAERAENQIRKMAKNSLSEVIDKMSIEEVKAFMEKMGLW